MLKPFAMTSLLICLGSSAALANSHSLTFVRQNSIADDQAISVNCGGYNLPQGRFNIVGKTTFKKLYQQAGSTPYCQIFINGDSVGTLSLIQQQKKGAYEVNAYSMKGGYLLQDQTVHGNLIVRLGNVGN